LFVFTTQGNLHSKNIEVFLMPTLLADTIYFFGWIGRPHEEEAKSVLRMFHFHPPFNRGLRQRQPVAQGGRVFAEEATGSTRICFIVVHAVDLQSQGRRFATSELNFFSGKFSGDLSRVRSKAWPWWRIVRRGTGHVARAPDRVRAWIVGCAC